MRMKCYVVIATVVLVLTVPTAAAAQPVARGDVAPSMVNERATQAGTTQAGGIARWLKNVAWTWTKKYTKKVGKELGEEAVDATATWVASDGTECNFPLPQKFCSSRTQASAPGPVWGLGVARSWSGGRPGIWNKVTSPRSRASYGLVPGIAYWLKCWAHGDWIRTPGGYSNLWYRLSNDWYTPDVWLDTGTNNAIPGVQHCRR
jgi:hypothetical protein